MLKPQSLVDIFTSAVVAVGMFLGGIGLYTQYAAPTTEDKRLVETCLPAAEGASDPVITAATCTDEEITKARSIQSSMEQGRKMALAGLFTIFAGGMIGGTASYARVFSDRMKKQSPKI